MAHVCCSVHVTVLVFGVAILQNVCSRLEVRQSRWCQCELNYDRGAHF